MHQEKPAVLAQRRARWLRPDADRWLRPDWRSRKYWVKPPAEMDADCGDGIGAWSGKSADARDVTGDGLSLAELQRAQSSLAHLRWLVADLKFDLTLRRLARKYSPDQPRVTRGDPDGGQWTDAGGGSSSIGAGSRRELMRIAASNAGSSGQNTGESEAAQVGTGDSALIQIQRRFAAGQKTYQRCLDLCYPLLERFQPPGVDYNQWDFHRCLNACLRRR